MRRSLTVATAMWILLHAVTASAVADPTPNRIGIYFDAEANQRTLSTAYPAFQIIYITVTNPTFSSIFGWQAAIRGLDPQTMSVMGTTITGAGYMSGSLLQYDIAYETPLVVQPVTVLATVFGFTQNSMHCNCLVLTGIDTPAVPETQPLVWTQSEQPSTIQVASLYSNGVAAAINESPIPEIPGCWVMVATESTTWSRLKARFH